MDIVTAEKEIEFSCTLDTMVLVLIRLSGLCVFAPLFNSSAVSVRVKAAFTISMTLLIAPVLSNHLGSCLDLNFMSVTGEIGIGCVFGLTLALLTEALSFAGVMIGMQFSFSLVNLLDPNTMVDTPVLGQMLNWIGILTLLSSGLHRSVLSAFIHTFEVVPPGAVFLCVGTASALIHMLSGIFVAGVQLAAPVMAAAIVVEITIALVGRLSPQLPVMLLSIPVKTCISYVVLIGSLSLWPMWIERYFSRLLRSAESLVTAR